MPLILGANSVTGGYEVDNSLRFNSGSSDYLSQTQGSGNRKTFTVSFWVKKSKTGNIQFLFNANNDSNNNFYIAFWNDDTILIQEEASASGVFNLKTNAVYRDVSAWYHIVVKVDTTQATASDRLKLYINGVQITSFSSSIYPSLNYDTRVNNSLALRIGARGDNNLYLDGYMSEYYFIDGQQLDPTSFGEFDEDSGIWKPIAYTGTYGTNGFYLEFKDSSALGDDTSGNSNDFTVNNLTSIDQTTDTPTNNFATMNPLTSHGTVTLAEGNNQVNVADNTDNCTSSFMVSSGKWYWEGKYTVGTLAMVGIRPEGMNVYQTNLFNLTGTYQGYYYYADSGNQRPANTAYGNTFAVNDIIGIALDLDNNKLYFSKNGVFQNSGDPTSGATGTGAISIATSGLTWGFSFTSGGGSDTFQMNFGNPPFAITTGNSDANGYGNFEYAVPSGYYALNTKNLAEYG
jgi:hypothetical protein